MNPCQEWIPSLHNDPRITDPDQETPTEMHPKLCKIIILYNVIESPLFSVLINSLP